ncbi:MAG: ABC transporter substrate-binding protein [Bacillaceae bacterium]|nr:ABC transporter substrate-binding protein [Bacillaceae bacterium]
MKKKFYSIMALVLSLSLLLLAGCGGQTEENAQNNDEGNAEAPESYKIGAIVSKTGPANALGEPEYNTLQLLEKQINDAGGINGVPLELILVDDETNQDKATQEVLRMINDENVLAVIGPTVSGISLALKGIALDNEVPMVSFAAAAQIVDPEDPATKWVFKTPHSDEQAVGRIYQYLNSEGIKKIGIIHDSNAYGEGGREKLEELAEQAGVEIVGIESYQAKDPDMSAQLTNLKSKNPEAIIVWGITNESATVAKNMKSLGFDIPLIGSHGIANEGFLQLAGEDAEGIVIPTGKLLFPEQIPSNDPQYEVISQFNEAYQAEFNSDPTNFASYAYDGLYMVVEALKNGATDRASIRDYLENDIKDYVGATGIFNMSPDDHLGLTAESMVIAEVKDGQWVLKK